MIGNDIVDLKLAKKQSNWQRKGFLEKQFSASEIKAIRNSEKPFELVWLFWSMKEAAYKSYLKSNNKRFFAPQKFNCCITSKNEALVNFLDVEFRINYIITTDYIHSWVAQKASKNLIQKSFFIADERQQSTITNQSLLANFTDDISINKNEIGIPYLTKSSKKLPISISTAHHGNYGAYAILHL